MPLKLEVGKKYVRNDGGVVTIKKYAAWDPIYSYLCDRGCWYTKDGRFASEGGNPGYAGHLVREASDSGSPSTGEYQLRMVVIPPEGGGPTEWTDDMNEATHFAVYRATSDGPLHRKTWEWVADFPMSALVRTGVTVSDAP